MRSKARSQSSNQETAFWKTKTFDHPPRRILPRLIKCLCIGCYPLLGSLIDLKDLPLSDLKKKPIQISLFSGAKDSLLLLVAMPLNSVPMEGTSCWRRVLAAWYGLPKAPHSAAFWGSMIVLAASLTCAVAAKVELSSVKHRWVKLAFVVGAFLLWHLFFRYSDMREDD